MNWVLRCGPRTLSGERPRVMGVLNVTPDSFSDGGRHDDPARACALGERMAEQGADLIDVGGESTRPGASPVTSEEELRRVLPVVERLATRVGALLSVDTSNPELMRRAADAGAHLINDVRALRRPGALEAAAGSGLGICLMHMQGEPADMQRDPRYVDVLAEVRAYLGARLRACQVAGIAPERLCIDPGFGFGKTLAHNLALLRGLEQLSDLGRPVLVGLSRKSMVAALSAGRGEGQGRLGGSIALALEAVRRGAAIVRVHDVAETVQALAVQQALAGF